MNEVEINAWDVITIIEGLDLLIDKDKSKGNNWSPPNVNSDRPDDRPAFMRNNNEEEDLRGKLTDKGKRAFDLRDKWSSLLARDKYNIGAGAVSSIANYVTDNSKLKEKEVKPLGVTLGDSKDANTN